MFVCEGQSCLSVSGNDEGYPTISTVCVSTSIWCQLSYPLACVCVTEGQELPSEQEVQSGSAW